MENQTQTSLTALGERLKQARLEKRVSLADISAETRINIRFLEAIEQGNFRVLPQTYVRAFLREYASMVGLEPEVIMQQYDGARTGAAASPAPAAEAPPSVDTTFAFTPQQKRIAIYGLLVVFAVVAIILIATNRESAPRPQTSEISFDNVVRETEAAVRTRDTADRAVPLPRPVVARNDSLRLEISTVDSVWISVLIDGTTTEAYLLGPNRVRTLTAGEKFTLTMGNAGGASFRLNGRDLGVLGKRGAVLRNVTLSRSSIPTP